MDLLTKVETLLKRELSAPDDKIMLEENDGVYGYVISSRFKGMDTIDRLDIIWNILDSGLKPKERRNVLTIVAITPREAIAHSS